MLCHIAVLVGRTLAPLDVLLVDEDLNALLDHADTGVEPGFGLVNHLKKKKDVDTHKQVALPTTF